MRINEQFMKARNGKHWHANSESESQSETFETFKMECGDRRIPLTLRAVIWLRRLEQEVRICGSVNLEVWEVARVARRRASNLVTR